MIRIRFSPPNQLEISGGIDAFRMIRQALLDLAGDKAPAIIEIPADTASEPTPYERALSKLVIGVGQGPTTITQQADAIHIGGSSDNLERLASFFDFSSEASTGQHNHYEYFEGNAYIAPDAIPLVVHLQ